MKGRKTEIFACRHWDYAYFASVTPRNSLRRPRRANGILMYCRLCFISPAQLFISYGITSECSCFSQHFKVYALSGLWTTDAGCGSGIGRGHEDNISHSPEEMVIYINIKSDVGHILQDQLPVTVCLFAQQPQGHQPSFSFQQWQWWQKTYKNEMGIKISCVF